MNHRFSDSSRVYGTCIHQFYSLFTATVWGRLPFGCEPWRAAQCTTPECVLLHIQLVYAFKPIASYSTCILLQSSVRCASGRVLYTAYTHFFHFLLNAMVWDRLPFGSVPRCAAHIMTPVCVLLSMHRIYLCVYCIHLPLCLCGVDSRRVMCHGVQHTSRPLYVYCSPFTVFICMCTLLQKSPIKEMIFCKRDM